MNSKVPNESIDGMVIFVGIDFPELESYFKIDSGESMAGIEVIAHATQTLIDRLRDLHAQNREQQTKAIKDLNRRIIISEKTGC